ncbi:acyltransferase (plasmid) [Fulvitalea axinellae]|uniref:Acyltransferase n=1 Tax=Fulvitalea axinellae TaxID=1182444 RepID=A0AAU9CN58_9BACT|nr:acyltransferase [Fulvitalea axinellae]
MERRYDIDWLRVIAIGLLLIYHIAIIFQPWAMFIGFIKSDEAMESLWQPMRMLNIWRIPLLFFVSGMGVHFAMGKRNIKQLLLERAKRILLPFIFGALAICPLHFLIFQKYYNMPFSYIPNAGHLWFLGNIFAYVLLLSPIFYFMNKLENGKFKKILAKVMSYVLGPFIMSGFFLLEVGLVKPQLYELYAQTTHGFFIGLIAFYFGYIFMYSGENFWKTVTTWKWLYIGIATALFILRFTGYESISNMYLTSFESNCWVLGVFGLAHQNLNKPSALLSYLSPAVYPVYIIHMVALYAGAWIMLPLELTPLQQFIAITIFTFLFCFLGYELLLKRLSFLRPLFGLSWKKKIKATAQEVTV